MRSHVFEGMPLESPVIRKQYRKSRQNRLRFWPTKKKVLDKNFFSLSSETFSPVTKSYYTEAGKTAKEVDYVCNQ